MTKLFINNMCFAQTSALYENCEVIRKIFDEAALEETEAIIDDAIADMPLCSELRMDECGKAEFHMQKDHRFSAVSADAMEAVMHWLMLGSGRMNDWFYETFMSIDAEEMEKELKKAVLYKRTIEDRSVILSDEEADRLLQYIDTVVADTEESVNKIIYTYYKYYLETYKDMTSGLSDEIWSSRFEDFYVEDGVLHQVIKCTKDYELNPSALEAFN